ncbi:alkaline phosphatase family protein [Occallatibacter savannae]|uniref:alkaline phosphatase family protein n=1 Tax=Occallatibacter savannae TaxID=1002691 RepID=UPI0013A5338C|nr:alkaline phosphatase family protein [Occallatibacter savannae]
MFLRPGCYFRTLALWLVFLLSVAPAVPVHAQEYVGKPNLVVIIVIDQFRGDYLNRQQARFKDRGFNLFMKEGAWFTDCYYDYANTKTAPGHATIGTGAYSDGHGIESNEWWDASRSDEKKVTSVEDERYQLVDIPAASIPANAPGAPMDAAKYLVGASPLNLRASTLGDEMRLATQGKAKVFGVSLKDRAAILPPGHAANGAFWIDAASGQFTTSTYYMEHLPEWARQFNSSGRIAEAEREANVENTTQFFELVGRTPAANSYEFDFAKALIKGENLGQRGVTDLLTISLSANDIQGHQMGPDSDSEDQMILALDGQFDKFFSWLDQNIGLNNVWLALSADHGIAPIPGEAARLGMNSAMLTMTKVYDRLEQELNKRHSPGAHVTYLMPGPELPYINLNRGAFEKAHITEQAAEEEVAALLQEAIEAQNPAPPPFMQAGKPDRTEPSQHRLPPAPQFGGAYTRLQMAYGQLPQTEMGRELAHSYAYHGNWFVMLLLGGYQMEDIRSYGGTTHFSPWSYDRHVPLAFYGSPFVPGEYHERVAPVDLATTFAAELGINFPSAAVGRVLTQALKPEHAKQ